MEFPNLGKRCFWSECNNLDFLPFTCTYCNQIFCKDHFNQEKHQCESVSENTSKQIDIISFVCSSEGCSTYSSVEMLCSKCQKHFCLVHRYHDCFDVVDLEEKIKWDKPKEQFAKSISCVNSSINKKIKKAVQDPKKQATALKIQLMRLKGKAEGSPNIPTANRMYFLILLPKGCKELSKPVYINKEWSVGRMIDSVSDICNIINDNNKYNSPKLRLFKATNGTQISSDTSTKLDDLINNNTLINGETLILEYISPKEDLQNFILSNFSEYKES